MIKFKLFCVNFSVSFLFISLICWIFVYDVDGIAIIYLLSSIVHEVAHILTLLIFSVRIEKISLNVFGFNIKKAKSLSFYKEFFVLFSGCFSNFILILIFIFLKNKIAVSINGVILILNLLPIHMMDGGQILKLILDKFLSNEKSYKILKNTSIFFSLFLLFFILFIIIYFKNVKFIFIFLLYVFSFIFEE